MLGQEGALAAAGAAGAELRVPGVQRAAVDVVDRLEDHHALRVVRLAVEDGAGLAQRGDERRVLVPGRALLRVGDVPGRGVVALDVDVVLDGDGHAVQRADGLALVGDEQVVELARAVHGLGEEDLRQAVGQLLGDGGLVAEGLGDLQAGEGAGADGLREGAGPEGGDLQLMVGEEAREEVERPGG